MSERDLDDGVRALLRDLPGVLAYHTFDSRRSSPGFLDWFFCGKGGSMWTELKTMTGKVTPAQQRWIDVLTAAGHVAVVRRPCDLLDGTIARELAAIAGLRAAP